MIPDNSLSMVQLFFLTRGIKRVIINAVSFRCRLLNWYLSSEAEVGGVFHITTDWEAYAEHMLEVMCISIGSAKSVPKSNDYVPRPESRPAARI